MNEEFENSRGAVLFDLLLLFAEEVDFEQRLALSVPLLYLVQKEMTEEELRGIIKLLKIDLENESTSAYCRGLFSGLQGAGILNITEQRINGSLIDEADCSFLDGMTHQKYTQYKRDLLEDAEELRAIFSD